MLKEQILLETFAKRNITLSIAESCTGGLLSNRLTNIPGSSKVFLLGITAYSNSSKNKILKIPEKIIRIKGAVSYEVCAAMAKNIRELAQSTFSLAISGIAGPGGGTKIKPVGTIFIAAASRKKIKVKKLQLSGNRLQVKRKAADKAIAMLLEFNR